MSGCPLSSKDPPPEMDDRGSLDHEDDHFRQRLLYKSCSKQWYRHLDTISRGQDALYHPRIQHQRWRIGAVLTGKMTISGIDCFTKAVPKDDTDIWTRSPNVRMPQILLESFSACTLNPWGAKAQWCLLFDFENSWAGTLDLDSGLSILDQVRSKSLVLYPVQKVLGPRWRSSGKFLLAVLANFILPSRDNLTMRQILFLRDLARETSYRQR